MGKVIRQREGLLADFFIPFKVANVRFDPEWD